MSTLDNLCDRKYKLPAYFFVWGHATSTYFSFPDFSYTIGSKSWGRGGASRHGHKSRPLARKGCPNRPFILSNSCVGRGWSLFRFLGLSFVFLFVICSFHIISFLFFSPSLPFFVFSLFYFIYYYFILLFVLYFIYFLILFSIFPFYIQSCVKKWSSFKKWFTFEKEYLLRKCAWRSKKLGALNNVQ
jgi:hypothetical protein